ncbi:uncharacterized protein LOC143925376 [Lithobates pipiens]
MEPRAKLAAAFLGICFIFAAFPCVSSTRVYNPEYIIEQITKLLTNLEEELKHLANKSHFRVRGPTTKAWEGDIDCTGSFLDIFTNGTQAVSGEFSANSVTRISRRISKCVKHLEDSDCTELERYHDKRCEKEVNNQTAVHFVKGFLQFSKVLWSRGICGQSFRQKYDRRRDDLTELDHIC